MLLISNSVYLLGSFESNDFESMLFQYVVSQRGIIVLMNIYFAENIDFSVNKCYYNGSFQVRKISFEKKKKTQID